MFEDNKINGVVHHMDWKTGFLKQTNPKHFTYDESYIFKQSTTLEMSYLRLGLILSKLPSFMLEDDPKILEIGPGNGVFLNTLKKHFKNVHGYDVAPSEHSDLSEKEAKFEPWDVLIACDVIEHMPDIDELFSYNFKYAYISTPWMPPLSMVSSWRHFKPDEHIWYIKPEKFNNWVNKHGYDVVWEGCPEDIIRHRWNPSFENIASFVIRRR